MDGARRQQTSDTVADVIWWLKGYRVGCEQEGVRCDFGGGHLEALAEVNTEYRETTEKGTEQR